LQISKTVEEISVLRAFLDAPINGDTFNTWEPPSAKKPDTFALYAFHLNGKETFAISCPCNAFDNSAGHFLPNTKSKDTKWGIWARFFHCASNCRDNLITRIDLRVVIKEV
jgi:hypothetical protein